MIAPYIPYVQKVTIKKEDYNKWAEIVRSEQMDSRDQVKLFDDNPDFAQWYFTHFKNPR